jgi:hypothetical protein
MLLNFGSVVFGQENIKGTRIVTAEDTPALINRALIAGISGFMNIDDLQFAHSDALSFYNYLRSPAGGSLDKSNITLLLNQDATSANFYAGLDWFLAETKEGETAAIYFSGHGDLETKTIRQNGFLLSYDSPKACYMASLCSLTGKNKEGLEWQERVFEKGFNQFEYLQSDPGMAGLRGTQGYESIIKKYTHPR